jgi:hypothetical protein
MRKLSKDISKSVNKSMKNFDKSFSKSFDKNFSKNFKKMGTMLATNLSKMDLNVIADCNVNINDININNDVKVNTNINNVPLDEQVKNYSKTYAVDRDDVLDIDNRYGKITVNTWARNEFKVDVQIKVATNKDGGAKEMLDGVNIKDSKQGSTVYFKTSIDDDRGSWSNGKTVRKIEINYTVYMPAKNGLTINNKYGSTELPDLAGKVTVNNSYGSLSAKNLSNSGNSVQVKYGSASIGGYNGDDLNVAYGNLSLDEATRLNANVSYGAAKIGVVKVSCNINVKYSGGLNINSLDKNCKDLSVNSSYSNVKVGVGDASNTNFDVTVHYGNFNYDSDMVSVVNKEPADGEKGWNPTKNFKGHLGKGSNSDKNITIKSNYGSVKFE